MVDAETDPVVGERGSRDRRRAQPYERAVGADLELGVQIDRLGAVATPGAQGKAAVALLQLALQDLGLDGHPRGIADREVGAADELDSGCANRSKLDPADLDAQQARDRLVL